MFLQHGFQGQQNRTDHLPEQLILVREVIIYVPDTYTDCSSNLTHGGFGIPLLPELLPGYCQYAAAYVFLQHLHK